MHDQFHTALEQCDVPMARRMSAHLFPHLPQPTTDAEALVMLHRARTEMPSMPLKLRAYSHRWLLDHGYPSALPDELKPRAERMYPVVTEGVGISVHTSRLLRPVGLMIRGAMEGAVMDAYAGAKTPDPAFVRARMMEARESIGKAVREMVGDLAGAT
jgi:hypothetical protein